MKDHQEEFEDTKGVIRIRKSKNRQHNGQKQEKNKVFILSILVSQFNFSHSSLLLPKYTPNALIGFSDYLMSSILSLL
jgi:hypothetical protein